jgi:hypothetical protein
MGSMSEKTSEAGGAVMKYNPYTFWMNKDMQKELGMRSQFEAKNPYDPTYLQAQINNQAAVMQQQQDLATMLQAMTQGKGPNPAQTMFNQNASQNIQGAQGLIASQRGLNPALATRMGANMAANANQQAAGESALLGQRQQIAAMSQLGDLYNQMQQTNLQGQSLYGGQGLGTQQLSQSTEAQNAKNVSGMYGSVIGAGSSALTMGASGGGGGSRMQELPASQGNGTMVAAHGGMVPDASRGMGGVAKSMLTPGGSAMAPGGAPASFAGQFLKSGGMPSLGGAIGMKSGGMIPGKAAVPGDSIKNDKVPVMASPKEIIIPRSISTSKDAPEKAKQFVAAILARQGMKERRK